ncbi:MAG: hypothetical protein A2Y73_03660 [Chloroflexi bacterium RBG_13_56_8]|nr:MAG: hypothetical protein A2Y73_03660 [Chloroflexi bacterium RBG_13_56_8]
MERSVRARRHWFRVHEETLIGYSFLLPAILILIVLVGYPAIAALWYSFSDKMIGYSKIRFVGLDNYATLFGGDWRVGKAALKSFLYAGISVVIKLPIGLGVAMLLNRHFRGRGLVRGVVLLPWALPIVVSILIWSWMYNDLFGVFNFLLMKLGLISAPVNFLGSRTLALPSVLLTNIWRGFPFFAVNLLAGLVSIPDELYEAARVDGASRLQSFRHITLPGVRTVALIISLLSFIWTSNDFTSVWVLTKGGPGTASEIFPVATYKIAFSGLELGKGAAVSVAMMPFLSVLIVLLTKAVSGRESER